MVSSCCRLLFFVSIADRSRRQLLTSGHLEFRRIFLKSPEWTFPENLKEGARRPPQRHWHFGMWFFKKIRNVSADKKVFGIYSHGGCCSPKKEKKLRNAINKKRDENSSVRSSLSMRTDRHCSLLYVARCTKIRRPPPLWSQQDMRLRWFGGLAWVHVFLLRVVSSFANGRSSPRLPN